MTVDRYFRREGSDLLLVSDGAPVRIAGGLVALFLDHISRNNDERIDDLREVLGSGYTPKEVRWTELRHLQTRLALR